MLSAVYVAAKAEESYVSAERLAAAAGAGAAGGAQGLLRREPLMLQALEFDLLVYLPHRALEGFWADVGAARVEAKKKGRRGREEENGGRGGGGRRRRREWFCGLGCPAHRRGARGSPREDPRRGPKGLSGGLRRPHAV